MGDTASAIEGFMSAEGTSSRVLAEQLDLRPQPIMSPDQPAFASKIDEKRMSWCTSSYNAGSTGQRTVHVKEKA